MKADNSTLQDHAAGFDKTRGLHVLHRVVLHESILSGVRTQNFQLNDKYGNALCTSVYICVHLCTILQNSFVGRNHATEAIIGMFFQNGLTGEAWGSWSLYTDSPLRALTPAQECIAGTGGPFPENFWDPAGITSKKSEEERKK